VTDTAIPDPQIFYRERIPAQWNRMLDEQEQLGKEGRELFEGMKAVNATIRVDILDSESSYFLNIADGCMAAGEEAAHPPFLTLRQNRAAYERLAAESGDSALAMLGGLTGMAGDMRLTQQRVDKVTGRGMKRILVAPFDKTRLEDKRVAFRFGADLAEQQPA
jgi:hypothetical protein